MKACPKCGNEYPDTTTLCPSDGVALEKTDDSLLGKTLAGKYRIDERLSEGGMGTVYRGTHVLMDKTVAVKVLRPSLAADEKIVARFSREARAASRINHPHALSVTDFGEDENGVVFLVMEYLSGQTLKQVIRSEGPMPLTRVVEIITQVGGALDEAHGQGVVHRDLKSDNIMLITATSADYAKVLDFGIAKIKEAEGDYDPGLTSPGLVIGTPQYMSPEQCSQAPDIDARSDIYSLGVIIFEMLVGHVPFTGESPTVIMLKQMQQAPPSLAQERPDVPAAVETVVNRALEKRPEKRYETVSQLVEDLTIAAGMQSSAASQEAASVRTPSQPLPVVEDDDDEETLVRRRYTQPMPQVAAEVVESAAYVPPPTSGFNPLKILVPSVVGLLLIFGVIYAFTWNSQAPTEATQGSGLTADPNSKPVEAATPPTGESEAGIPSGGSNNQNANNNSEPSPQPSSSPEEVGGISENSNQNSNKAPVIPTATQPIIVEEPLPTPTATKPPVPKPTLPPPSASPPGIGPL
ncbi:MAG TPA: serine/threonine-protein kinase [Pyrinomonadaceae bacterium]|nr:serine/threonine-protein kinase [Pyrinomonadaceae bacterium]